MKKQQREIDRSKKTESNSITLECDCWVVKRSTGGSTVEKAENRISRPFQWNRTVHKTYTSSSVHGGQRNKRRAISVFECRIGWFEDVVNAALTYMENTTGNRYSLWVGEYNAFRLQQAHTLS
jgi:hypothetical protein